MRRRNKNPHVDSFLTVYSQSERSTGGTRGYDAETYVETKLDLNLVRRILCPETKLVVLTGNAGDGKTAFIQRVEELAQTRHADFLKRTDNGCTFVSGDITYQTLYDDSQDFEGTANDAVLAAFFRELEGEKPAEGSFTKVIAINEGRLRDFILDKPQYRWLGKQVHHYLNYDGFKPHDSLVFVNLNLRSVVGGEEDRTSIFDFLLDKFLQPYFWESCATTNCDASENCPLHCTIANLRDPQRGPEIRRRLKRLLLAVHFRKTRHITMRDLRSILSLILFGKFPCKQIHQSLNSDAQMILGFYYNAVFNGEEKDRVAQLLSDLDIARVCNPKLDNFIHFHAPDSPEVTDLFIPGEADLRADMDVILGDGGPGEAFEFGGAESGEESDSDVGDEAGEREAGDDASMGPPIFIGGDTGRAMIVDACKKLQWGRRFSSAEIANCARGTRHGKRFNGAADFHRRR